MKLKNFIEIVMLCTAFAYTTVLTYLLIEIMIHKEVVAIEPNGFVLTFEIIIGIWISVMLFINYLLVIKKHLVKKRCKEVANNGIQKKEKEEADWDGWP